MMILPSCHCSRGSLSSPDCFNSTLQPQDYLPAAAISTSTDWDSSWKEFLYSKTNSQFGQGESLWIDAWYSPCWLPRGKGPQPSAIQEQEGEEGGEEEEFYTGKTINFTMRGKGTKFEENKGEALMRKPIKPHEKSQLHTLVASLKACAKCRDLHTGCRIHADIVRMGLLKDNEFLGSSLISMYAKCGSLTKAQEVFNKISIRSVVLWSALIAGYAQHGDGEKALKCFEQMQFEGLTPNSVTFVCALKACGSIGAAEKGQEIHAEMIKEGLLEKDIVAGSALVAMYAKCGLLEKAQGVLDMLPVRNEVSWNALITEYVHHGHGEQALKCFEQMQHEGLSPTAVTFACALKACGIIGAAHKGQEIHAESITEGLLENDLVVGTALVDMYAKCGLLTKAQEVFDKLPERDGVLWCALITGYVQHGHGDQAVKCFEQMQLEGLCLDAITFTCLLKACSSIGAAEEGKKIHGVLVREGLLKENILVGSALVDMYAKCGLLAEAQEVFDRLPVQNVVSWNALMAGYALLGQVDGVFYLFEEMVRVVEPNLVTFTILLNACNHAGQLNKAQMYFGIMSTGYGLMPILEHYTCMVDLFARSGHLDKAVTMIKEMPFTADLTVWLIVLGACQKWGNWKVGRLAFEHAVQLNEKEAVAYVCMRNIYADAGKEEDLDKFETLRVNRQPWTKPGHQCWTDASGMLHSFSVRGSKQAQSRSNNFVDDHEGRFDCTYVGMENIFSMDV